MSKEKHRHKKKRRKGATNENEDQNERPDTGLFTEVDAKSVEVSGYTVGRAAPQNSHLMQGKLIPTGVVDIDKSVRLPPSPPKSDHQHRDSKPNTTLRPNENDRKGNVRLPSISRHHHPYGHVDPSSDYHHFERSSYPYPYYYKHYSPHHHKYEKEVETYDPRWWYMPINSVHRPKPWQSGEYHYVPPKWYESSSKQSSTWITIQASKSPPHKHVDCRCEVCRPSQEIPHGTKLVIYD